ncbi:MAG: glycoside hydrolase family 25 protein [Bacteroidetes bacterium]|nr:MAG: glycoside hydrolase family 25 protein [Bacteroidota bacterium]
MNRSILVLLLVLVGLFACQEDTLRRMDYPIHGIDVSRYQASIDWPRVAAQDMHFVFMKATEGGDHCDEHFPSNWWGSRRVGLLRGAYHFFRPQTPAKQQAEHYIATVYLRAGDLPPALDVEVTDGLAAPDLVREVQSWLTLVEQHYGVRPILYTNLKFYNKYLAGHFADYPLWLARYHSRPPQTADGQAWHFWQYGDRGRLDGIDGYVDFNVFYGNWADLEALCVPNTVLSWR